MNDPTRPMSKWLPPAGAILAGAAMALFAGRRREEARAQDLVEALLHAVPTCLGGSVDFASFAALPAPVARYFWRALTDGQPLVRCLRMRQTGELRTGTRSRRWAPFTACQIVVPAAPGFVWDARVALPLAGHVRVLDSYRAGIGAGRVSLLSAFAVMAASGAPELASGALHRYLAEAVWTPTALLPASGVRWTAIDDRTALATLADRGATVSLEFRFDAADDVVGIHSPGRFARVDGGYRQMPWQGRFGSHALRAGMRVPTEGDVGWFDRGAWETVWRGRLVDARYEFASAGI